MRSIKSQSRSLSLFIQLFLPFVALFMTPKQLVLPRRRGVHRSSGVDVQRNRGRRLPGKGAENSPESGLQWYGPLKRRHHTGIVLRWFEDLAEDPVDLIEQPGSSCSLLPPTGRKYLSGTMCSSASSLFLLVLGMLGRIGLQVVQDKQRQKRSAGDISGSPLKSTSFHLL